MSPFLPLSLCAAAISLPPPPTGTVANGAEKAKGTFFDLFRFTSRTGAATRSGGKLF